MWTTEVMIGGMTKIDEKKGKLDYGTPKVSERKQLKRNYDNSLEGTESVRKEAAGYHSQSLNKYVVESQFCVSEHETIWKDRKSARTSGWKGEVWASESRRAYTDQQMSGT
jgi:hypothetical protein